METVRKKNRVVRMLRLTIARRFNLHLDKADENEVVTAITKSAEFKGANLWTLIFAIFIASIGLNVNSTAVIIGAMLISPLMGPIMGIGLGIGISDFELVKKGSRNLLIATLISVITSTFYFWATPLHDAQTELLARTTPSVWDVFIAFFGGLAGIVAGTRKEKSNVIPGVAIATALMPPLCTAGYGLASGNLYYFMGALYLYFINSVFICLSTLLIVRFLRFRKRHFEDKAYERKVSRYILLVTIVTILPSIYVAYRIVDKSIFINNANRFVKEQFHFTNTQVVSRTFRHSRAGNEIDLLLIGHELPQAVVDSITGSLPKYRLGGTVLKVRQGLMARQEIDFSQIRASIMEDVFSRDSSRLDLTAGEGTGFPELGAELKVLFPDIRYYTLSNIVLKYTDAGSRDSLTMFVAGFSKQPRAAERQKLHRWLTGRLQKDTVKLVVE